MIFKPPSGTANTRRIAARLGATMTAGALAAGLATTVAQPAQAYTEKCKKTYLRYQPEGWFAIPVDVTVNLCVTASGDLVYARGTVHWERGTGSMGDGFDRFALKMRLERNDADIKTATCTTTKNINERRDSHAIPPEGWALYCRPISASKGSAKTWTADGTIIYNYNNDGKGDYTSQLNGTPRV
ncbi:hypothetical protein [Actinomadura flavalba]|uniref:hypothetical protein n=1 Tax=Actinomadura flavalba TaxID=1120938 RepID=UPI00037E89D9|nr:hypothetical protein [Actinomadura flavalba]